jgi:hypothetical protein
MHRKILMALACAVISAPAFAQVQFPHRYEQGEGPYVGGEGPYLHLDPTPFPESAPSVPPNLSLPTDWDTNVRGPYNHSDTPYLEQRIPAGPPSTFQLPDPPLTGGQTNGGYIGGYKGKF